MIPPVGSTCRYEFKTKFSTLNGVYKTASATTFLAALASGTDFVENLYTPVGLTQADFDADYDNYTKDTVLVLQSVSDSSVVFYIPESILGKIPDPTIRPYLPLVMVVNLGVFKDTQQILPLINEVKDLIEVGIGSTETPYIVSNSTNTVYLTDSEYAAVEAARAANKAELIPLSVQLRMEQEKVTRLAAQVAQYEQLILAMQTP